MTKHRGRASGSARAALLITIAVFAVWGLLWAVVWYRAAGGGYGLGLISSYLRVEVSPRKSLWVEVRGSRLRTAETPQALAKATWESREGQISLPVEPEESGGLQAAGVGLERTDGQLDATWNIVEKDVRGESWECTAEGQLRAVRSAARAPTVRIPRLSKADLKIVPQPEDQEGKPVVRVALQLHDAGFNISDVRVGGTEAQGEARVLDATGKVVGKKKARLADLGFT
jgi:hypothetical protein